MLAESEIVALILCLGILLFFLSNLERVREASGYPYMMGGYLAYLLAMVFTNLESFAWAEGFNFLEHLCYLVCALCLAGWMLQLARAKRGAA